MLKPIVSPICARGCVHLQSVEHSLETSDDFPASESPKSKSFLSLAGGRGFNFIVPLHSVFFLSLGSLVSALPFVQHDSDFGSQHLQALHFVNVHRAVKHNP